MKIGILCATSAALLNPWTALYAQNEAGGGAAQPAYQQRLNTIVRKADASTNQTSAEAADPLSFYRKNPELMKRYFPHLYQPAQAALATPQGVPAATYQIEFNGGTAQDLVDRLTQVVTPAPNIILSPESKNVQVPAFELNNVTLPDLFQALNNLSKDKSAQWQLSGSTEPIWVLTPVHTSTDSHMASVFRPRSIDPLTGAPIYPKAETKSCLVLPVGTYLANYKLEDITTAVKTAWGMLGDDVGAEMKFHKDTELLIAVGTKEQLGVLSQVLKSLTRGSREKPETEESSPRPTAPPL